jgi:hypothetical protein
MHSVHYKYIIFLMGLVAITGIIFSGCSQIENRNAACRDCISHKPDSGYMAVIFSPGSVSQPVTYSVHEGTYEEGKIVLSGTAGSHEMNLFLATGVDYTVAATYRSEGQTTVVISTGRLRARKYGCTDKSGEVTHYCWRVLPAEIDVALKE